MRQTYQLQGTWTGTCDTCQAMKDAEQLVKVQKVSHVYKPQEGFIKVYYSRTMAWICTECEKTCTPGAFDKSDLRILGALYIPRLVNDVIRPKRCNRCTGTSMVLDLVKRYTPVMGPAFILIQEGQICLWCVRHLDHFKLSYEGEGA